MLDELGERAVPGGLETRGRVQAELAPVPARRAPWDGRQTRAPLDAAVRRALSSRVVATDRLGAVAEARRLFDGLVEELVEQARGDGSSWEAVGAALGVSRQAAQQKFGPGRQPRKGR
jgi:hypothetical protein